MDLRGRLSRQEVPGRDRKTRITWWRWVLFTTLLLLLSAPFFLDFSTIERSCISSRTYRPVDAVTGKRLPDSAAVIFIGRGGVVRVSSGEEMSLPITSPDELNVFVDDVVSSYPDRPFVLRIDKEIPYESVDEVLTALKTAGVHEVYFHNVLPDFQ